MIKWKKNQDKLDEKLIAETDLKIAQVKKIEAETFSKQVNHEKLL
jgi:hypothetical protein